MFVSESLKDKSYSKTYKDSAEVCHNHIYSGTVIDLKFWLICLL